MGDSKDLVRGRHEGMGLAREIAENCEIYNARELPSDLAAQAMKEIIIGAIEGNRRATEKAYDHSSARAQLSPERDSETEDG